MRKLLSLLFTLLCFSTQVATQNLIPAPHRVITLPHSFALNRTLKVTTYGTDAVNERHLYRAAQSFGGNWRAAASAEVAEVVLTQTTTAQLPKLLGTAQLDATFTTGAEGYVLHITTEQVNLYATTAAGTYYGIQTLRQLLRQYSRTNSLPGLIVYDRPDIAVRAWQDDISRGPIPTLQTLKRQIELLSSYKLNHFTLYTEHVFQLDGHPGIAPPDGLTREELRTLSDYAREHHVTLIGNYQSFGHMEETLAHPAYRHLAENEAIISPALPATYDFLREVYSEIVPAYDGEYFHVGCDETFGLGDGPAHDLVDSLGVAGVYVDHINRLDNLLAPYGKKLLMWGDIALAHPEIIPALPDDMTVVTWSYDGLATFDPLITPLVEKGLDFWVAPGINGWGNTYPDLQTTATNVYNFIRDGFRLNTTGVLNTSWDDDGLNLFEHSWHGFVWGAENAWNAPPALEQSASIRHLEERYTRFNRAYDVQFFGQENIAPSSITNIMHRFSYLRRGEVRDLLRNQRLLEPVFPLHREYVTPKRIAANKDVLEELEYLAEELEDATGTVRYHTANVEALDYAIRQAQFTVRKNLLRGDLYDYLYGAGTITLQKLNGRRISLIAAAQQLRSHYAVLWRRESRDHWLPRNLEHFDKLIQELATLGGHVLIEPADRVDEQGRTITLRSVFGEYPIHYTLDGSAVTAASPRYTAPFSIDQNTTIKARAFTPEIDFPEQRLEILHHLAAGRPYQLNSEWSRYHPSYDGGGPAALLDGREGKADELRSGRWQGFSGQDIVLEIDLEQAQALSTFAMGFYQNTHSWVIFPPQVKVYHKPTATADYELFTTIEGTVPPEAKGELREVYTASLTGLRTRYLKVVARYYGKLPAWHHAGSSYESMIFADEVVVR